MPSQPPDARPWPRVGCALLSIGRSLRVSGRCHSTKFGASFRERLPGFLRGHTAQRTENCFFPARGWESLPALSWLCAERNVRNWKRKSRMRQEVAEHDLQELSAAPRRSCRAVSLFVELPLTVVTRHDTTAAPTPCDCHLLVPPGPGQAAGGCHTTGAAR